MRASWLVVLAACGGGTEPAAAPSAAPAPAPVAEPPAPVHGMHGRAIVLLAATPGGDAAVSADGDGAIRLWPTLDGASEPIVVTGSPPRALAVAREGDGFVIANHDAAKGVELVRLDATGIVRSRARIEPEPAVEQVELTAAGALVLRADQSIELFDLHGARRGRMVPDPGERIFTLVARGGRVLAIVGDDSAIHARWIDGAGWGHRSPDLPLYTDRPIALSPDHTRLVGSRRTHALAPALVEIATGKLASEKLCTTEPATLDFKITPENVHAMAEHMPMALGFFDATTVVCANRRQISWWNTDGTEQIVSGEVHMTPTETELVIADGRIISAVGGQLALLQRGSAQYLGYSLREMSHLRIAPTGVLIGMGDGVPVLLAPDLREVARYPQPKGGFEWTDLLPLDERYVLRMASRKVQIDEWSTAFQITVFDMVKGVVHQQLPNLAQEVTLSYEPATRLLATSDGAANLLLRYDPATHAFGERFVIHEPQFLRSVHLLDPALSGGLVALTVEDTDGAVIIGELHGDDLHGTTIRARRSYRIAGQLRAIDRSGRVYAQQPADGADIVVYAGGAQFSRLPGVSGPFVRPSPDARHVATVRDGNVHLVTVEGRVLWRVALWNSIDIAWTTSGELVARYKGALATLDRATGALRARQCGWRFGIADKPLDLVADQQLVCDVAP